ncbi:MAG: Rieske 2Fe-2S domain-containing protein [Chloroflexia bacterium]
MTRQASTLTSPLEDERFAWLDTLASPLQSALNNVFQANDAGRWAKRLLNGVPIRHRVHPALVAVPIGAWTTALLLDALDALSEDGDARGYRKSADAAVALGVLSALPTAASGLADWVDLYDHQRRVGTAHALANTTALALYSVSIGLRLSNSGRGAARMLSLLGYTAVAAGGVLGGEMVYGLGVNVSHLLYPRPPKEWTEIVAVEELSESTPVVVEVGRVPVMLLRRGETIIALQDWCPHAGGPLSKGEFTEDTVVCPWHQSCFSLHDGAPLDGPATTPARTFEVREEGGMVWVRPSHEAQSWPPPPDAS